MVSKCFMLNIMFYVIVSFGCKVIHNIRNTQKKGKKLCLKMFPRICQVSSAKPELRKVERKTKKLVSFYIV